MHYKIDRKHNLLNVSDDFAHLRSIRRNGSMNFDFSYQISPQKAIEQKALVVNVSVISYQESQKSLHENTQIGRIDTRTLIQNIITQMATLKTLNNQRKFNIVAFKSSDITSKINNEIIGSLIAKKPTKDIQQLNKSVLKLISVEKLKDATQIVPVLQKNAHVFATNTELITSSSIVDNPTKLMYDLIVKQGVDPSDISKLSHRSMPSIDAKEGTLRPSRLEEYQDSVITRLLNYHLFSNESYGSSPSLSIQMKEDDYVQVLVNEPHPEVEISVPISIPRFRINTSSGLNLFFFVKFELVNSKTGVIVDSVIKPIDVAKHQQFYYIPQSPPVVGYSRIDLAARANLIITQTDEGAESVQIYRKLINAVSTTDEDYVLIGTHSARYGDQPLFVNVDLPRDSTALFRVVPVGKFGAQGFEYTNVVIKSANYHQIKSLALSAVLDPLGIKLEAYHIPQQAVSIEFKVRDLTLYEQEFTTINDSIELIDDSIRSLDNIFAIHREPKHGHVYEYAAKIFYFSGTSEIFGSSIIEFISQSPGKVDTKIENLIVETGDDVNVTFSIITDIIDTNLDVIKVLLQKQDLYDFFKEDLARQREMFKSLIAHNVQRINLTDGVREDFGVITTSNFSDRDIRKNQAIQPLDINSRYRYEVTALLRSPETLFETLIKEKRDLTTNRTYKLPPSKFLHPLALTKGILVTSKGLETRFSKNAMSHGAIGEYEIVEVSFDKEKVTLIDCEASRFDKFLNSITWNIQGDVHKIDHFLIMKEVHGIRTIIGKVHAEFSSDSCQYLHPITRRDEGMFSYIIVPIFHDYTIGGSASTNVVIVESFSQSSLRMSL